MKRLLFICFLSLSLFTNAWAQRLIVTGTALDTKSKNPVSYASAALLRTDSTAITATTTDDNGNFCLKAPEAGRYIVKLSYVGFSTATAPVELTATTDSINIGNLLLESDDNILGTATVSVTASRVEQKEDTTMFNAAAYRVPEGSTLESLIKQLPGVEIGDDGSIKWNGKTVNEFLINGKDFFKGDTETAMKNLPTDLVSRIKAYDKKSDYAEQTGVDDGEETTVLDITTKRELNESWILNADLAYGNHDRYSGRFFATRFTDRSRIMAFGSANNTNDKGFGGHRGWGGGEQGLVASKMAGLNFSWENGKEKREAGRLELGGNVRYRHRSTDALITSNSETFLTSGSTNSFVNAWNHSIKKSTNVNTNFRMEWNPDSMTNITFRPAYSYSESKNSGTSLSATFNDNPFGLPGITNPLDSIFAENAAFNHPDLYAMMVNTNRRLTLGDNKTHNVSGTLNIVRRFNNKGRNLSLRLKGGYSKTESNSFSIAKINYNQSTGRPNSFLNQYSTTPSKSYNYDVRLGYVEPIGKNWYAETRYTFGYKYSDSNRSRYNLDSLAYDPYASLFPEFVEFGDPENHPAIGSLPNRDDVLNYVRDLNNSQYATYKYLDHTANVGIRYNSEAIRFNAGVDFNPEETKMEYNRPGQHIDTLITRNVFKISPQIRFRYKFSKTSQLDIMYRGYSSQPSMTDLLAVVDDSDPLNISMGNPGLKPAWNNWVRAYYNTYMPAKQFGLMVGGFVSQTNNSISNRLVYDETTGVRYTRPENINGNWNGRTWLMINSALGKQKLFNISSYTSFNFDRSVGYISTMSQEQQPKSMGHLLARPAATEVAAERNYDYYNKLFNSAASQKNNTRTLGFDEHLNLSYRASWFDVGLLGRLNYQHARASVQDRANMDTWNFAYGANANFMFDFGLSISTDLRMTSRRGYTDASMNTNELVWNAQIAQSFLKNNAATISIQFYDILQKQSNISRTLTATQRSDSWSNAINSYFMVHFIYKLNIINGKMQGKDQQKGERMGPPNMRGHGGMPLRMGRPMHMM